MRVGSTVRCVPWFLLILHSTCDVSCVELQLLPLCFAASIPCVQTVDASPCGPWTVISFRHLFVKVNDVYVRFIAQSLPPFATSKKVGLRLLDMEKQMRWCRWKDF